jgi:hypothetical protein
MYGSVDYTPYKTSPQAIIETVTVPLNIEEEGASSSAAQTLTANMVKAITEDNESGEVDETALNVKQRILEIRNQMREKPEDLKNAGRMNEMFGLIGLLDKDKRSDDMESLKLFMNERKDLYAINKKSENAKTDILGETAMLLDVAENIREEKYSEAIDLIGKYDKEIRNADNKRDLLCHKVTALESVKNYTEALEALQELKEVVKGEGVDTGYTAPSYDIWEENLYAALGIEKNEETEMKGELAEEEIMPETFNLFQNYPNPFNPTTRIEFSLPEAGKVKMEIYDITGRLVEVLADRNYEAGYYGVTFNGKNLASGVYIVRANLTSVSNPASSHVFTRKLMLLK